MDSAIGFVSKPPAPSRANKPSIIVGEPVTWVIRKATYRMEESSDGLPIFNHSGFSYKATASGAGSISWYIRCLKFSDESQQCFVQGVRHTDGRLLMLRRHNHPRSQIIKTPKRVSKITPLPVSLPTRVQVKVQKKSRPKSLRLSLPTSETSPVVLNGQSRAKYPRNAKRTINNIKQQKPDTTLITRMQDRWKAARRKSALDPILSAVEMRKEIIQ